LLSGVSGIVLTLVVAERVRDHRLDLVEGGQHQRRAGIDLLLDRGLVRAVAYLRLSKDEGDGAAGIEAQRAKVEEAVAAKGADLVATEVDLGLTAANLRRPGIARALDLLASGTCDTLIVARLDRLTRSMLDFAAVMERSRAEGWSMIALDVAVDTSTPAGEALVNVLATFAQFERRLISQRTKEALAIKRAQGIQLGRRPAIPDDVVRRIKAERARGAALRAICDGLERDGIPTGQGGARWWPGTVAKVLAA
jgi:DNA invertase Pin-like site-specific DNA recombinase